MAQDEKGSLDDFDLIYDCSKEEKKDLFEPNQYFTIQNSNTVYKPQNNWKNIYGTQLFNALKNKTKVKWQIKCTNNSSGGGMIGVSGQNSYQQSFFSGANKQSGYSYYSASGTYYNQANGSYGQGFNNGDTITLELDLINKQISYWKNNTFEGIAYQNINCNNGNDGIKYRLALSGYNSFQFTVEKIWILNDNKFDSSMDGIINSIDKCMTKVNKFNNKLVNKQFGSLDKLVKFSENVELNKKKLHTINKKIENLGRLMNGLDKELSKQLKPESKNYKEWDSNQALLWIISLENGRFKKYSQVLGKSFNDNSLKGGDLPDVTRRDLQDFGVKVFGDRVSLEKYCQGLGNQEGDDTTQIIK